ncbi:unnamed protein product [Amaranthus hypochondriacus]
MTWVECHGLPPMCWSPENYRAIGEKWGKVICIEHEREGMTCLTYARILVATTIQQRIEACIRMEWESGKGDVWVREVGCFDGNNVQRMSTEDEEDVDINKEGECNSLEQLNEGHALENLPTVPSGEIEEAGLLGILNNDDSNHHEEDKGGEEGNNKSCADKQKQPSLSNELEHAQEGEKYVENSEVQQESLEALHNMEGSIENNELVLTAQNEDSLSIDELIIGHYSCPEPRLDCEFDPMASIECSLSRGCREDVGKSGVKATTTIKRPRGRPKRLGNSLPTPCRFNQHHLCAHPKPKTHGVQEKGSGLQQRMMTHSSQNSGSQKGFKLWRKAYESNPLCKLSIPLGGFCFYHVKFELSVLECKRIGAW